MKTLKTNFDLVLDNPLSVLRFCLALIMGSGTANKLKTVSSIDLYTHEALAKTWIVSLFPDGMFFYVQEMYFPFLVLIIISALGAAIGLLGRFNLFILAVSSFILEGFVEGLGNFDHNYSLPSQILLILAMVPGSMRISVDSLLFKKFSVFNSDRKIHTSGWGINLVLTLVVVTYFTAGISKIRYGGADWLDGSTLTFYLQNHDSRYPAGSRQLLIANASESQTTHFKDNYGFQAHTYGNFQRSAFNEKIADWLVSKPAVVSFFALMTIIIEVCGFVVFFNSKWRNAYLITVILMHTSIGILMGLFFTKYRLICFLLIDWKLIFSTVRQKYGTMIGISND
ncbi:hypothetical protein [Pricia sp.]|uniref:hypothetical protein n=1 Tax=Pricia sp. TaxID=2268138 RepID=UPI003592EB73